jgi:hypothetical protein
MTNHWLGEVWIWFRDSFIYFTFIFYLEIRVCLSRGVQVTGAEDWRWPHRSGTRWSGDREFGWRHVQSAPYTWRRGTRVSWLGIKTKVDGLSMVCHQNHWNGFSGLTLKPVTMFSWLSLKTKLVEGFSVWASKPTDTVWWFMSQNHRVGFLVWSLEPIMLQFVGCATKLTGVRWRGTRVEI